MWSSPSLSSLSTSDPVLLQPTTECLVDTSSDITSSKVDLITNTLRDTDIQEYILRSYVNCLHTVQERSYAPHFQVTKTSSGDFLILCFQKSKPVRADPTDVAPVDGLTVAHMCISTFINGGFNLGI